jgi:transcriptional regulator with XRE-family HTH domain
MDRVDLSPGTKLKRLRESLGMTVRDVEEHTERMALDKDNPDFAVSKTWLADIENGVHVPSIFKLYSLSAVYNCSWVYLNSLFNLRTSDLAKDQALYGVPKTRLLPKPAQKPASVFLPLRFRQGQTLEETNLLAKLAVVWGDVPIELVRLLSPEESLYGFVGLDDDTLGALVRPGSFVQIDVNQRKVLEGPWATEEDREIYFVELRNGYACSWCELRGRELWLVPHPKSGLATRRFEHPREAEIVGQVTGVAMRIASTSGKPIRRGNRKPSPVRE